MSRGWPSTITSSGDAAAPAGPGSVVAHSPGRRSGAGALQVRRAPQPFYVQGPPLGDGRCQSRVTAPPSSARAGAGRVHRQRAIPWVGAPLPLAVPDPRHLPMGGRVIFMRPYIAHSRFSIDNNKRGVKLSKCVYRPSLRPPRSRSSRPCTRLRQAAVGARRFPGRSFSSHCLCLDERG